MDTTHRSSEPRRRHKRFRPPRAQVSCVPRGFWTSLLRKTNVALGLKDLSLGGAQIVADRPLKLGAKTDVTLWFPGVPYPVELEADVRWCKRDTLSLHPKWTAGLTIKHLSAADETRLADLDRTYLQTYLG
ncbi:MAG TPA: PilZ domain-containing protein [Planctomycetota bacterium]|nr:PilZ domain-containing protein [Planctomycetota bacterium]